MNAEERIRQITARADAGRFAAEDAEVSAMDAAAVAQESYGAQEEPRPAAPVFFPNGTLPPLPSMSGIVADSELAETSAYSKSLSATRRSAGERVFSLFQFDQPHIHLLPVDLSQGDPSGPWETFTTPFPGPSGTPVDSILAHGNDLSSPELIYFAAELTYRAPYYPKEKNRVLASAGCPECPDGQNVLVLDWQNDEWVWTCACTLSFVPCRQVDNCMNWPEIIERTLCADLGDCVSEHLARDICAYVDGCVGETIRKILEEIANLSGKADYLEELLAALQEQVDAAPSQDDVAALQDLIASLAARVEALENS